jgi:hypothetical protein
MRSNPYWAGPGRGDTAEEVGGVLTARMLEALVASEGSCVLYTHLGKVRDPRRPFGEGSQAAFRRLAALQAAGKVLVTTTYRLLRYQTVRECLRVSASRRAGHTVISIGQVEDPVLGSFDPSPDDLMGLTFVTDRADTVVVELPDGDVMKPDIAHDGPATIASVPWRLLEFPDVH